LSGIKEFESRLTPEYQKFRDVGISVSMKSEIAEKGFYSNIIPYIKQNDDENLYPTGGVRNYWLIQFLIFLQMKIQRKR
jgi:putative ATP-dependent endonuclease of OLD family